MRHLTVTGVQTCALPICYTGSKNLTFSGAATAGTFVPTVTNSSGTAINFGSITAISFSAGVATVSGSEEHTTELQSQSNLVCRLLLGTNNAGSPDGLKLT